MKLHNKRICDTVVEFNRDGSAYFSSALWVSTGNAVCDEDLDLLCDAYADVLEAAAFERLVEAADFMGD